MLRIFRISVAAVVAANIAMMHSASAADFARKAPPAMNPSWSGFYVGGNVGYGWTDQTATFASNGGALSTSLVGVGNPVTFDATGALGGIQLGFNTQFSKQWLVGVEADFNVSNLNGNGSANNNTVINFPFSSFASESLKWLGTERIRLGFLPTNSLLLYGTAGVAQGSLKRNVRYDNNQSAVADIDGNCGAGPGNCYTGSSSRIAVGWTAGAGFEYAIGHRWTARAEYLYVNLGGDKFNQSVAQSNTPGVPPSSIASHFNATQLNIVRTGLNYRF